MFTKKLIDIAKPLCMNLDRKKKHVSIIVSKGEVISIGSNQYKTHPIAKAIGYRYSEMHSELNALLKTDQRKNLHLYNFRFNRFGEMRIARPCCLCMPWCKAVFKSIHFSSRDGMLEMEYEWNSNSSQENLHSIATHLKL
jgi:hypothetical protein